MPVKKKSCFQITSVTQAQVAAGGGRDDAESLEDPDESRAEDVSRAEFEAGVCDRSSSEETLNSVGEPDGHFHAASGPPNGGLSYRNAGSPGLSHGGQQAHQTGPSAGKTSAPHGGVVQQSLTSGGAGNVQTGTSQPATASTTTTTTAGCNSRFRVIKLDHGTGEPFRRGRWTCTEFNEKDPEGSVISRTADSIRHPAVLDASSDRDSGLGSIVTQSGHSGPDLDPGSDTALPLILHAESQQQVVSGPATLEAPPVNKSVQNLLVSGHNAPHQPAHVPKSPSMPTAPPAQTLVYPPHQQLIHLGALGHQLIGQTATAQTHPATGAVVEMAGMTGNVPLAFTQPISMVPQPGGSVLTGGSVQQQYPPTAATHGLAVDPANTQNVPVVPNPFGISSTPATSLPLVVPVASSVTIASPGPLAHRNGTMGAPGLPAVCFMSPDETRRKSDVVPQPPAVSGTEVTKALVPDPLQLANPANNSLFGINIDGEEDSSSGASIVAIDNKIEQAMDLVKSHLMYAVREEVEVLKEQIKELFERNSVLERENTVLKSLANSDQLSQLSVHSATNSCSTLPQQTASKAPVSQPVSQQVPLLELRQPVAPPQPNVTSA
ncbi:TSC22 domain family protein 2-like isoform X2 [Denticeps clupeoides]|uniref:TSC22 domain family protein 2 n=1 Tax=Denticeps clupeoides TaxID=299321 RepID=A0AAY4ACE4_9TELE|nr:TSC22 domain family protein 2-like isoform X2 [Denticeps clupeoides]